MGVKVRERPKGSGVWWIFIDHQGKRRSKKIGDKRLAMETARQIEARLLLNAKGLLGEEDQQQKEKNYVPTLREYVYGWKSPDGFIQPGWFDKHAVIALKMSTWTSYKQIMDRYVLPSIGNHKLDQITPRIVANLLASQIKKGLRSTTVKNIKHCLSSILSYAHRPDEFIERNPARGIRVPRPESERPSREPDPFTWEERRVLESVFEKHFPTFFPLVVTGLRTGLRLGEIAALKWGDIDFHTGILRVKRNISRGRITTPKSRSSVRDVRLTGQTIAVLKDLRVRRKEEALRKGWQSVPEWVFCNENGGIMCINNFRNRVWNRAMELSGLRRRTPHDMRHTYATLRLSKGDSLAEVAKEMGHSSAEITFKTYYKWLPRESRSDINELDGVANCHTQPSATYPQPERKKDLAL